MTVYMTDLAAFAEVGEVYATFFGDTARSRGGRRGALPRGAQVEIDAIVSLAAAPA